jgi:hypothetical protein
MEGQLSKVSKEVLKANSPNAFRVALPNPLPDFIFLHCLSGCMKDLREIFRIDEPVTIDVILLEGPTDAIDAVRGHYRSRGGAMQPRAACLRVGLARVEGEDSEEVLKVNKALGATVIVSEPGANCEVVNAITPVPPRVLQDQLQSALEVEICQPPLSKQVQPTELAMDLFFRWHGVGQEVVSSGEERGGERRARGLWPTRIPEPIRHEGARVLANIVDRSAGRQCSCVCLGIAELCCGWLRGRARDQRPVGLRDDGDLLRTSSVKERKGLWQGEDGTSTSGVK